MSVPGAAAGAVVGASQAGGRQRAFPARSAARPVTCDCATVISSVPPSRETQREREHRKPRRTRTRSIGTVSRCPRPHTGPRFRLWRGIRRGSGTSHTTPHPAARPVAVVVPRSHAAETNPLRGPASAPMTERQGGRSAASVGAVPPRRTPPVPSCRKPSGDRHPYRWASRGWSSIHPLWTQQTPITLRSTRRASRRADCLTSSWGRALRRSRRGGRAGKPRRLGRLPLRLVGGRRVVLGGGRIALEWFLAFRLGSVSCAR